MKIYTKNGDKGFTGINNKSVPKYSCEIECVGDLCELNSNIGYLISLSENEEILKNIQNILFDIGACIHDPSRLEKLEFVLNEKTSELENDIDHITKQLPPLTQFILPSGGPVASYTHVVRSVCRRAERQLVKYFLEEKINDGGIIKFMNRLSDYFFTKARLHSIEFQGDEHKFKSILE